MKRKALLLDSIKRDLALIHCIQAQKKEGIHPIRFTDQNGNTITRLYDFTNGQFAKGSIDPTQEVENIDIKTKTGRVNDMADINDYQETGKNIKTIEGKDVQQVAQKIESMSDEELKAFINNPVVSSIGVLADNVLENIDTLLGDTSLGKVFPSRTDREIFKTSIKKAKRGLTEAWNQKEGGGVLGVINKASQMLYNKAVDALPDNLAMFIESKEFKTAIADAISYTSLGMGALVGLNLAQGLMAAKGLDFVQKNKLYEPSNLVQTKQAIYDRYKKVNPDATKQMIKRLDDLVDALKTTSPSKLGRQVFAAGLKSSVKLIPAIGMTTLAVTTAHQLMQYTKADEAAVLKRMEDHVKQEFELFLDSLKDRPPYQVEELINQYLNENQTTNIEELARALAAIGISYSHPLLKNLLSNTPDVAK